MFHVAPLCLPGIDDIRSPVAQGLCGPPGHPRKAGRLVAVVGVCVLVAACDTTSISGLNVRAGPTTTSPVVASVDRVDTSVGIDCFVYGEPVHGDPVWYRIDRPYSGYVTNYYVDTSGDGLADIPSC